MNCKEYFPCNALRKCAVLLVMVWIISSSIPVQADQTLAQEESLVSAAQAVITFSRTNYDVYEAADEVVLTLNIAPIQSNAIYVNVTTYDATAQAGSDFTRVNNRFRIPAGSSTFQIRIPLLSDATYETTEQFKVWLSNPSSNARLGTPSQTNVNILDQICTHPEPENNAAATPGVFRYLGYDCRRSFAGEAVGDSDYYRFRVDTPTLYNIYLYNTSVDPKGGDYDLYLYRNGSPPVLLSQSAQHGTVRELITAALEPGEYLIQVYWYSNMPLPGSAPRYTLKVIPQ